jgi:hypothetical protein
MTIARPIGAALLLAGAALALPAVAAAAATPALHPRARVLTAGPFAGRVAVAADVLHPADALRRTDTVRIDVSRGGSALATGTDRIARSRQVAVTTSHQIVLSPVESRRVRAAARGGHRVRLTVTIIPGDGGAVRVATATVALGSSGLPPLSDCYRDATDAIEVDIADDGVGIVSLSADTFLWTPLGPPGTTAPLTVAGDGSATWSAAGGLIGTVDGFPSFTTTTFSGTFAADGLSGSITLGPPYPVSTVALVPCFA